MKEILDFLQTVYPVGLDPKDIPSVLQRPFNKAAERFQKPEELKGLDRSRVGICEEVADLAYQVLKMACLQGSILNERTIKTLQDFLEENDYYDSEKRLVGLDYQGLDKLSVSLVHPQLVERLHDLLPPIMFIPRQDNGYGILRDFLAGQFVAYISRLWREHEAGGLQNIEYLKDKKIPEETRELIEAIIKSDLRLGGDKLMAELANDLQLSQQLLTQVYQIRQGARVLDLFAFLPLILNKKMAKPVTIEDTLHLMFLKMKGRQELDFMGVPEQTMRYICKPVEYLIEADMFF